MELSNDFTNILERSSNGILKENITTIILNSLISKNKCREQRDLFILSGQRGDLHNQEKHSKSYLDCHHNSLTLANATSCSAKYLSALSCLNNTRKLDSIPVDCVPQIDDVLSCVNNH